MLNIKEIVDASQGVLLNGNEMTLVKSYKIDSREVTKSDFFIPIVGEKVDSHKFLNIILKNKPCGFFLSDDYYNNNIEEIKDIIAKYDVCIVKVKDTLKALYDIGKYNRSKHMDIKVVAVTGSVGKTSTKEMIADVLETKYNVLKTYKNFNGYIGLSLMLLQLENQDIAVLEHGIDCIGEMDYLADASKPNVSIITNIGMSHIEHFKNQDNIFKEKLSICKYTAEKIFVNKDDKYLTNITNNNKISFYSFNEIKNIKYFNGETNYKIDIDNKKIHVKINDYGDHNIINSLVAIKIGIFFQIEMEEILKGISNYRNFSRRFELIKLDSGKTIIDDTYNASYDSFKSGIESLKKIKGEKILILGDILETGDFSKEIHKNVGKLFKNSPSSFKEIITFGENSKNINEEASKFLKSSHYDKKEDIVKYVNSFNDKIIIYLKASNGMNFNEIIEKIT